MNGNGIKETGFQAGMQKYYEGIFAQGSGYLSTRGSLEEGITGAVQDEEYLRLPANVTLEKARDVRSKWGTYIPGIVGKHPALKEEIINLPYFWDFKVWFDEEALDMEHCNITEYSRELIFSTGELKRCFVWNTKKDAVILLHYNRIIDYHSKKCALQDIQIEVKKGAGEIRIESGIDGNVRTNGFDHTKDIKTVQCTEGSIGLNLRTDSDMVWMRTIVKCNGTAMTDVRKEDRRILFSGKWEIEQGDTLHFEKITAISTSRDEEPADLQALLRDAAENPEDVWKRHYKSWNKIWEDCSIEIEGNDVLQQAVNFSVYHLLRCNNREDARVGICAKGYTGEAYFGRCFWDTEVGMLPFYIYTDPEAAKNLLLFRYHTLDGAKQNAENYGYAGARYAWESSIGGEEQCAAWNYCDHEIHITADVVYALMHYYRATGDEAFLQEYGIDIMVETARYWRERTYQTPEGKYELNGVMGPDEYLMFVDNDAYTNALVRYSLSETVRYLRKLCADEPEIYKKCESRLQINPYEIDLFEKIAGGLKQQTDAELVMQCDRFDALEEIDFEKVWKDRLQPFGLCISQERNYRSKALKQASVLQLMYEMPWIFTEEQIKKAYEYYVPYTTHDSSLSAGVHAIIAAQLGKSEEAENYLKQAIGVDLKPESKGAEEGIHIANCGNLWQFIVFGLAGMQNVMGTDKLQFKPHLLPGIKKLVFSIFYRKKKYKIRITKNEAELEEQKI